MKNKRRNKKSPIKAACLIAGMLILLLSACGCVSQRALHVNYMPWSPYAGEEYLNSELTVVNENTGKKASITVEEIENLIKENDDMAHQETYELVSQVGATTHKYTGILLYELLEYLDVAGGTDSSTQIMFIGSDKYCRLLMFEDIKEAKDPPAIVAVGSDGLPFVAKSEGKRFLTEEDGYDFDKANADGPLKLVVGQNAAGVQNATSSIKYLSEIKIGNSLQ